jgi:hypothetical protein
MQRRLTFAAIARFAWAAFRSNKDPVEKLPPPTPAEDVPPNLSTWLLNGATVSPLTDKMKVQTWIEQLTIPGHPSVCSPSLVPDHPSLSSVRRM